MTIGAHNTEIQELFNRLFSSLLVEQQKIDKIRPAEEEKKKLLEEKLQLFEKQRGRQFFYRFLSTGRGHGPFCELLDGSVKYDLINAIGVNLLGHSHPIYIKSNLQAATSDSIMCGNLLPYQESLELTQTILDAVANSKLKHFWFSCSGSFANDTALKLIWQKKNPNYRLIAFEKSFAGRSVATQDITHNAAYREGMPSSVSVDHVPHFNYQDPKNSLANTLKALDELIAKNGNCYCAITLEIIQGEGGFIYGDREFYVGVFEWAKKHGLYIWVDEVQSFGRTTELFAFQAFQLESYVDVVTVGKVLQACGTLFSEELNPKPGLIAGTFNGSLAALNAGRMIIRYLREGNFYGKSGRIKQLEQTFFAQFEKLKNGSCRDKIHYYGGVGTMLSFEVGDSSQETTNKFLKKLFDNGIIAFSAGKNPVRVRFLLPLCLTDEHIHEIFQILEKTILETV